MEKGAVIISSICLDDWSSKQSPDGSNTIIKLKKGVNNVDIKAAIYISGNDFFPEVLKYYDKITKKESLFAFSSPKAFIPSGGFYLFMIKEEQDGIYKLVLPEVF